MEHTTEDFEYLMNTNVRSAIDVCKVCVNLYKWTVCVLTHFSFLQAAYPLMKANGDSSVINMGSLGGSDRALAGSEHDMIHAMTHMSKLTSFQAATTIWPSVP